MKNYLYTIPLLLGLSVTSQAYAATPTSEIQSAFADWRGALSGKEPQKIVDLYDKDAILLATLKDSPIRTQEDRLEYFKTLTANPNLAAKVQEEYVRVLDDNTAIVSGIYTFSFDKDGKVNEIPARYTFVYEKMAGKWMIIEHHSSKLPQS